MSPDIQHTLGSLEGKMDAILAINAIHHERLVDQDARLRELEQSRSALIGAALIISSVVSALVAWFLR